MMKGYRATRIVLDEIQQFDPKEKATMTPARCVVTETSFQRNTRTLYELQKQLDDLSEYVRVIEEKRVRLSDRIKRLRRAQPGGFPLSTPTVIGVRQQAVDLAASCAALTDEINDIVVLTVDLEGS